MSSTAQISTETIRRLKEDHGNCKYNANIAGASGGAATFLMVGALIVITCSCLCFMLSGVNAMTDIILPAIVPGGVAIAFSIPLIVLSIKYHRRSSLIRKGILEVIRKEMNNNAVQEMTKKGQKAFIIENFLKKECFPNRFFRNAQCTEYRTGIIKGLEDLPPKLPSDATKEEKKPLDDHKAVLTKIKVSIMKGEM